MLFNSLEFLLFFPTVFVLYYSVNNEYRWLILLAASYFFYMSWEVYYVSLILISTLVDYLAGLGLGRTNDPATKNYLLGASIVTNLLILFSFKYYGFVANNLESLGNLTSTPVSLPTLNVLLPIGISFYTFQSMSYTIDVYRADKKPETSLGKFALYVAFFPQLVAGPIERSTRLLPQFNRSVSFDSSRVANGLKLAAWGMFQKVVIADRLALLVDDVYAAPQQYSSLLLAVGTYFFLFQILCDFQGYTNIAQGTAKTLGFDLMTNFKQPYFAKTIPDFWSRFHISMTTWFRDYVYFPLAGIKPSTLNWMVNIVLLFSIIGLWHGANWTFLLFGLFHAIFYLIYASLRNVNLGLGLIPRSLRDGAAIFICFHIAWVSCVAFRANELSKVFYIWKKLPAGFIDVVTQIILFPVDSSVQLQTTSMGRINFIVSLLILSVFITTEWLEQRSGLWTWLHGKNFIVRWGFYYFLIFGTFFFGVWREYEFVYFQF
jgi:D-alanyl-lipoteichoic acid acyltransferase DltB (MBOAT superfamily)